MVINTCLRGAGNTRNSLIGTILSVFSDEDTNGNNGLEFMSMAAKEYFGLSGDENEDEFTEEELERYTTDNYMREYLLSLPSNTTEREIVAKAFDMYSVSMINYCHDQGYDITVDKNGRVTSITYAYVS